MDTMAKVRNNILTNGLSLLLDDQIVFRNDDSGCTILDMRPSVYGERVCNAAQLAHQEAFRQAIVFAKTAKNNPVYVAKAEGTVKSAYNVAVEDWFGQPVVLDIDISGWTGQIGQTINVKAQDNVNVTSVQMMIRENNGSATTLEQGEAVQSEIDGLMWAYTTTTLVPMTAGTRLDASARDLPRNIGGSPLELN